MSILVVLFFIRCRLVVCCGNDDSISLIIIFFRQAKNLGLLFGYWTANSSFKLMKKRLFSMNQSFCWFFSFRFWFSLQFIFPLLFSSSHTLVRQFWLWIDITWLNFFRYCCFCCCCSVCVSFLFPLFSSNKFHYFFLKLRFVHFLFHWLLTFLIIHFDWNYPQSSVSTYTNFNLKSFITNINISFCPTSRLVYWFSRYCLVNIMKDKSKS